MQNHDGKVGRGIFIHRCDQLLLGAAVSQRSHQQCVAFKQEQKALSPEPLVGGLHHMGGGY